MSMKFSHECLADNCKMLQKKTTEGPKSFLNNLLNAATGGQHIILLNFMSFNIRKMKKGKDDYSGNLYTLVNN